MPSSIDKLSQNLKNDQFDEVRKFFPELQKFDLIRQKGVYPYDYFKSHEQFSETCLPPQQDFFNILTNSNISKKQYKHAHNIWQLFECKNLGDYSDIYLKSDVLLLADIFENFRNTCIKTYELDPAHYYTAPGLSWDAMLNFTKIKLELFTDIDMIHYVKKGIRGGLAQCCKRYAKANNKYMKQYDQTKASSFLVYLDANNLYGYAMSQYLPYANFRWLELDEINDFDVMKIHDKFEKGYILEVDLEYPENIHQKHNDLPFCVENMKPCYKSSTQNKLIASVLDKKKYIIHYRALKQCLKEGLILRNTYRILEFSQKPWLQSYIDLNTELRTKATNSFEKDFFKLMNNSIFGKTIEDVEKRTDVRLVSHWENIGKRYGASNLISKPNFHSLAIFSENMVAVQMKRLKISYNKPIYVGFSILDISKILMYDFHYKYMQPKYENNISLLYTDTDSFIYEIKTDDFYNDIKPDLHQFDTSDYQIDNRYSLPLVNKKVLGKFKDELAGKLLLEFVGLKAKSYCLITEDDKEIKKIKGIKKNVVQNDISSIDFKMCLNENEFIIRPQHVFRSTKHLIYTQIMNKLALTNSDDKRFVIPNSFKTFSWGHKQIDDFYFI